MSTTGESNSVDSEPDEKVHINEPQPSDGEFDHSTQTVVEEDQGTIGASPRYEPNLDEAFDTGSEHWSLDKYLTCITEKGDAYGELPRSSRTSVLFDDLQVDGSGAGATYQQTIGDSLRAPVTLLSSLFSRRKEPEKKILYGIDGVVREGEMLLVLGRPGSGCSTLLKCLAGHNEGYLRLGGQVSYNGVDVEIMKKRFRGDFIYNAEVEKHFPYLNVGQTLRFAVNLRAPGTRHGGKAGKDFVNNTTDVLATSFGLKHTLVTRVGDDYIRGVSGGERKRVSIAEALACRASVGFWDNPTRGLDASTSLEFARAIRQFTTIARNTAVVALYQAGENLTREFDKVTILYLGRQVFFGTLTDAEDHFLALGFLRKPRQTTADFLTAITDPNGRRVQEGWEGRAPRSPDDFVRAWKSSKFYTRLQEEMKQYKEEFSQPDVQVQHYQQLQQSQKPKHARANSPFIATIRMQLGGTLLRAYQRLLQDKAYLGATAFAALFMGLINGSIFYNTPHTTSGFYSKGGVIFFCVLFNAVQTMSEVGTQYAQRPIVEKHKGFAIYHPFADSLTSIFADWPFKFLNVLIFDVIVYFMVDLKKEAGAFFVFLLFTYITTVAMSVIFRATAAATKKIDAASGIAGILVLVLSIYTGYVIPAPSMHPWFAWLRWLNPVQYGFEGLMANEFHGSLAPCTSLVPSGVGYENVSLANQVCAVNGAQSGKLFVSGDAYLMASFGYTYDHVWRNLGILLAFAFAFLCLCALATEINPPAPDKGEFLIFRRGHVPDHVKKALEAGKTLDDVEAGEGEVLTGVKTNLSNFHGLVKSKDIFTWENICYDIKLSNGSNRRLLSNVTGYVKPGTLTALMGESGAGKTTLLNVLAQRVDTGVVSGQTLVNGHPCGRSFQRRTGYVQQQDLHLAESTVREALRFSALLRQPADVPVADKYAYVESVIDMLEMEDYAEAVIGSPGNGLNVEQRKRTTIGIELVAKPALLLFLDEPTSGLDSQSAWAIVRLLRKLANSGQAILCTIHQPSSVLFEQFDRLLLLKKGGKTVYFGKIGTNSHDVINYFESNNAFQCPPDENPAEYILNVIGAGATARVSEDWHEIWLQSSNCKEVIEDTQSLKQEFAQLADANDDEDASDGTFAVSWWTQYKAVQIRTFQNYWRSPEYISSKMMLNTVAGLFLGFTFYKEGTSVQSLQNKLFAIFMAVILAMPLMNQLQPRWDTLASLYSVREKPSKIYHWSTFVLSNIIAELPYNMVGGTLFFLPWYFAVGFWIDYDNNAGRGFYMWLMIMAFEVWWSSFGQAIAAMSPNPQTAATFTTLFASFVISFNGVLQPLAALVPFWHWMYYLSPFTWLIAGLMENAVHAVEVNCSPTEINIFTPPSGQTCESYAGAYAKNVGKLLNPSATADCQYCKYSNADQYLKTVNMNFDDRWRNFGFMCAYILFNVACVLVFFYLSKVARLDAGYLKSKLAKKSNTAGETSSPREETPTPADAELETKV